MFPVLFHLIIQKEIIYVDVTHAKKAQDLIKSQCVRIFMGSVSFILKTYGLLSYNKETDVLLNFNMLKSAGFLSKYIFCSEKFYIRTSMHGRLEPLQLLTTGRKYKRPLPRLKW